MGVTITPSSGGIVKSKVTIPAADLQTANFIWDIPEYPAIPGYFWLVSYACAEIVNGSTPYSNQSVIVIQAENATAIQFRFDANLMQGNTGDFRFAEIRYGNTNQNQFVINDKLQIINPIALIDGDNDVAIYIGAFLIAY